MSGLPTVRLRQKRGQWLAVPADAQSRAVVGFDVIPVLRDFADGKWRWSPSPILHDELATSPEGAWWLWEKHDTWRRLLCASAIVGVRKATAKTVQEPSGSVGPWIGVFEVADVTLTDDEISLRLTRRIAEVR